MDIKIRDLSVSFVTNGQSQSVLKKASLDLFQGTVTAIIGESGSGKSVLGAAIVRLLDPQAVISGRILYGDTDLLSLSETEMSAIRGKSISWMAQNPVSAMDPLQKAGAFVTEILRFRKAFPSERLQEMGIKQLRRFGLHNAETVDQSYPGALSGGMAQRVLISAMTVEEPEWLIADEPTTALDVTIQAQILELMQELKNKLGMGIIMITHDLGVVASMCDHIAVMYAGEIIEYGTTDDIFYNPQHEYTRGLLRSIPKFHEKDYSRLVPIEGQPVDLLNRPKGCCFAPRCSNCMKICLEKAPVRNDYESLGGSLVGDNIHYGRCWLEQKAQMLGSADALVKGGE